MDRRREAAPPQDRRSLSVRFRIVSVGRERADPAAPLVRDYLQRIEKFFPIDNVVLKPEREDRLLPRISRAIADTPVVIGLDDQGRTMDSQGFAGLVSAWLSQGVSRVAFVIGGAEGLPPEVKRQAHLLLSLSKMTFPHRLARLLIAEQLYRALCIIRNTPYQK